MLIVKKDSFTYIVLHFAYLLHVFLLFDRELIRETYLLYLSRIPINLLPPPLPFIYDSVWDSVWESFAKIIKWKIDHIEHFILILNTSLSRKLCPWTGKYVPEKPVFWNILTISFQILKRLRRKLTVKPKIQKTP